MNTSYKYAEGYPYNTLAECKDAIDRVLKRCKEVGAESRPKEFAAIMNGECMYSISMEPWLMPVIGYAI